MRSSKWFDGLVVALLVVPIYGSFYPLESYLSLGDGAGLTGFALLPVPVTPIVLTFMTLSALWLLYRVARQGPLQHDPLAYGLVALAFISAFWSADPVLTLLRSLRLVPIVLLALLLPQFYGRHRCLQLMTVAAFVAALLSIFIAVAVPSLGVGRLGNGYEASWRGAMVQKNLTGAVFAIMMVIVYAAWSLRAIGVRLAVAAGGTSFLMVVMSQSGTALGAGVAGLTFGVCLQAIQRLPVRDRGIPALLLLVGAVTAMVGIALAADAVLGAAGRDTSFTGRTPIWQVTWSLIQDRPISGYGYGFWQTDHPAKLVAWRQLGTAAAHSHNTWLDVWLQLGLGGLLIAILITMLSLTRCTRLALQIGDPGVPALFALWVLLLIRSMTEVQYTDPFPGILFFPVWLLSCVRVAERDGRVRRATGGFRSRLQAALVRGPRGQLQSN